MIERQHHTKITLLIDVLHSTCHRISASLGLELLTLITQLITHTAEAQTQTPQSETHKSGQYHHTQNTLLLQLLSSSSETNG